jgi:hypothetical protein
LSNHSFPAVPSQAIPFPGTTTNYFSGGYITANHTSYASDVQINGLQMELNYNGVRDTPSNRTLFAAAFSEAIIDFLNTHFNMNWGSCDPLPVDNLTPADEWIIYPNPAKSKATIRFENPDKLYFQYVIYNVLGQKVQTGKLSPTEEKEITADLDPGVYFINLLEINGGGKFIKTFSIMN